MLTIDVWGELLKVVIQYGALGAVAAVSIWQSIKVQNKLVQIIESNTTAMIRINGTLEKCQLIHERR